MRIIGRKAEQRELQRMLDSPRSEFIVVTGRRRIGKTHLVRAHFNNEFAFYATGVAGGNMKDQIESFNATIRRYGGEGIAHSWMDAFEQLRVLLESDGIVRDATSGKIVVFIDEMPWLDTARSRFLPALEFFWNSWASARNDVVLIACGSATSWMAKNLLASRGGLHNRVTCRIQLEPFSLAECEKLNSENGVVLSRNETMEAYMAFGGVPYYWELLDKRLGLAQNIDRLCFYRNGQLHDEFARLFNSLFKHSQHHESIVRALAKRQEGVSRAALVTDVDIADGGTLSSALEELESCGFIRRYRDFTTPKNECLYQLIDPFALFWIRFVEDSTDETWWSSNLHSARVRSWTGRAFELLCLLHTRQILAALGVQGVSVNTFAWRSRKSDPGAQVDLVLDRADGIVNLCEMKYSHDQFAISKSYDAALRHKLTAFANETSTKNALHLTMVTPHGVKRSAYWSSVQSEIVADDLFAF
ncbi:MAG: ATP-binding protein [Eggerthellaceae bacterium]|nr:ATP-binding protein [Eggerthellaceae bacterium]